MIRRRCQPARTAPEGDQSDGAGPQGGELTELQLPPGGQTSCAITPTGGTGITSPSAAALTRPVSPRPASQPVCMER